jgi:ectoine hydroxylase-related dioxygenase (phytanoyl-CoA dioxygenase family)
MEPGQKEQLARDGYIVLRSMLAEEQRQALTQRLEELWLAEGTGAGAENYIEPGARRLANLANKGELFREIMRNAQVLEAVQAVIGPDIRLNMLNARDALPHAGTRQPLHCDTDHGGKPDDRGYYVCTAIWMLDPFTDANGATHLVPGSHRTRQVPKEVLADLLAPHPNEIVIEGSAGDVFVFNGHCWHSAGANTTDSQRRAILVHYIRSDHPRRLDYRQAISPQVHSRLLPLDRQILGLDD